MLTSQEQQPEARNGEKVPSNHLAGEQTWRDHPRTVHSMKLFFLDLAHNKDIKTNKTKNNLRAFTPERTSLPQLKAVYKKNASGKREVIPDGGFKNMQEVMRSNENYVSGQFKQS